MALRTVNVTITQEGRDKGKTFHITEMPSAQAEEWFMRAMLLLARSGADVHPEIFGHGAYGFAALGLGALFTGLGKTPWIEIKPLLDEMMECVGYVTPATGSIITGWFQVSSQIEEVQTRIKLREEVLGLHLGFSIADRISQLKPVVQAMIQVGNLRNTSTSPEILQ